MAYGEREGRGSSCTQIKEGWNLEDQKHHRKSWIEKSDMCIYIYIERESSRYGWNVILFIYLYFNNKNKI